jgi:adenine/guanine/hypoxanthine permease
MNQPAPYRWFVRRDLDGFFGLFIDNLVQLLLIVNLCAFRCGMTGDAAVWIYQHILPGAAVSILIGNLFYAWQARRLALRTGRYDVTALPYGINTPSLVVYVLFVMGPTYDQAIQAGANSVEAARQAWLMGLIACLGSGVIELTGSFVAGAVRRRTPRAALLSTLAGIAIGFIAMQFALEIYSKPLIAMAPLAIILLTYFSQVPFPWQLPGGLIAVATGTAIAWGLTGLVAVWPAAPSWVQLSTMTPTAVSESLRMLGLVWPKFDAPLLWPLLQDPTQWLGYLSVIVPMGLFNLVGSLQNIESAEAAGDSYDTTSSLAVNGLGTLAAGLFGSCFPTTIYIGHPGWKALGARAGYSTLNGFVVTALCLTGSVGLVKAIVPFEAGVAIVLWIGIIITAQAFAATPEKHAPAVAVGLFPAIAAWGLNVVHGAFMASGGQTMQAVLTTNPQAAMDGYLLHGLLAIDRGYIFTCMIMAAISAFLIDRKFFTAAVWSLAAAAATGLGLMHAYQLRGNDVDFLFIMATPHPDALAFRPWPIVLGYALMAIVLFGFGMLQRRAGEKALGRVAH